MKYINANLWDVEADLKLITTNGAVRRDGACVMGRGCALEAKTRYPGVEHKLGDLIGRHGNRVMRLGRFEGTVLASFPVKHHWRDAADPELIARSARQLVALADKFGYTRIALPRPGCGNGHLRWARVRTILEDILDDRFTIVDFPRGKSEPEKAARRDVARRNVVRHTQRSFRTGDTEKTIVAHDLDEKRAENLAAREDRLAAEHAALAYHVVEPA